MIDYNYKQMMCLYWTEQHKTKRRNIMHDNAKQTLMVLTNFGSYTVFCGQKVVLVF